VAVWVGPREQEESACGSREALEGSAAERRRRAGASGGGAPRAGRKEDSMIRTPFTGCGTALVTPFTRDGAVDEQGVRRLARRQVDAGIHFLAPCGTTGESPTLSEDERVRIVELVVQESAGRVPILAGAGGYDTRKVIRLGQRMRDKGAAGLLSVTPYYNKPTPEGLFQHYRAIAAEVALPIVVYNVPGRTGCNVDVATLVRLSTLPGIVGVKEASGNVSQMCEICRAVPSSFLVLSGDDALTLPLMAVGGKGIISVASNEVPAQMARMVELTERNDFAAARKVHAALLPLMTINFIESNPIPVKCAMAAMGLLEETYRLPMVPASESSRARIKEVLRLMEAVPA
jgi:4-hydroxy-tetrahydrodipicolinate synthase